MKIIRIYNEADELQTVSLRADADELDFKATAGTWIATNYSALTVATLISKLDRADDSEIRFAIV